MVIQNCQSYLKNGMGINRLDPSSERSHVVSLPKDFGPYLKQLVGDGNSGLHNTHLIMAVPEGDQSRPFKFLRKLAGHIGQSARQYTIKQICQKAYADTNIELQEEGSATHAGKCNVLKSSDSKTNLCLPKQDGQTYEEPSRIPDESEANANINDM